MPTCSIQWPPRLLVDLWMQLENTEYRLVFKPLIKNKGGVDQINAMSKPAGTIETLMQLLLALNTLSLFQNGNKARLFHFWSSLWWRDLDMRLKKVKSPLKRFQMISYLKKQCWIRAFIFRKLSSHQRKPRGLCSSEWRCAITNHIHAKANTGITRHFSANFLLKHDTYKVSEKDYTS